MADAAERAGTWGLDAAQCFHALSFAPGATTVASNRVRARVRAFFLKKKREKNLEKDSTDASYLVDKTNATRRRGRGWTRSEFCAGGQSTTCTSSRAKVLPRKVRERRRSSYQDLRSPGESIPRIEEAEERESRSISAKVEPINLLAPPLPPSYPLTHSPVEQNSTNATMCCVCDVRCSVLVLT